MSKVINIALEYRRAFPIYCEDAGANSIYQDFIKGVLTYYEIPYSALESFVIGNLYKNFYRPISLLAFMASKDNSNISILVSRGLSLFGNKLKEVYDAYDKDILLETSGRFTLKDVITESTLSNVEEGTTETTNNISQDINIKSDEDQLQEKNTKRVEDYNTEDGYYAFNSVEAAPTDNTKAIKTIEELAKDNTINTKTGATTTNSTVGKVDNLVTNNSTRKDTNNQIVKDNTYHNSSVFDFFDKLKINRILDNFINMFFMYIDSVFFASIY